LQCNFPTPTIIDEKKDEEARLSATARTAPSRFFSRETRLEQKEDPTGRTKTSVEKSEVLVTGQLYLYVMLRPSTQLRLSGRRTGKSILAVYEA